ncbi:WhiB family transcriptional regulator [Streptomyces sp. NPDC051016]|uniref:WhiB family transcriptional regulator n=1 Tax=Streptomyces sp. NPDC051016 TaxID=3365638 RepID=UPI003793C7C7
MSYSGSTPDTAPRRHDWMARMACAREDPDLFSDAQREHEARLICAVRCQVRTQCLAQVLRIERGFAEDRRGGVVAALTAHERWRLDATAAGHSDRPALTFNDDDPPRCGTYNALLRHLHRGEAVDDRCWSAEVRRDRLLRTDRAARSPQPLPETRPAVRATPPAAVRPVKRPPAKGETPHERRVYRLWEQGLSDLQIARRMAISTPQVARVRDRLGLMPHLHLRSA